MTADGRILVCAALSVAAHAVFARGLAHLPKRADAPVTRTISIRVVSPPALEPPPEPARPQPAPAPTPKALPLERPRARRAPDAAHAEAPKDVPPPEHPPAPSDGADTPGTPVFGVSMESTSQAGGGPAMPIGSPSNPRAARAGGNVARDKGDGEPAAAYEVTTMPLPLGRCAGKYTDEAWQAAVEGTVVLDLVVGADGRVRQIRVVSGLPHGLTEAAVAAAKACRFSPGQKGDAPVAVRIPEFKLRFVLDGNE